MKSDKNPVITIHIADNGVMVDWGHDSQEIYSEDPKKLAAMLGKVAKYFEGYFAGSFNAETIGISTKAKELWEDNEGI